ncbi:hypothetical protein ACFVWG_17385 [Kribbella sp. NPDC058245]|uniref:hypothetical protein n=1 Tax=Kribbella sp. NPDC058245 TaxID=3346399 RepID=UPI0036F0A980
MTAQTQVNDHPIAWTAIGRAHGRHRTYLIATCTALVLAAIGDQATGYDGPGPFIDLGMAVLVALAAWRFVPLLIVAGSTFFVVGGLATTGFTPRLLAPDNFLEFASGWLQMLSFGAAAIFAVTAVLNARRNQS